MMKKADRVKIVDEGKSVVISMLAKKAEVEDLWMDLCGLASKVCMLKRTGTVDDRYTLAQFARDVGIEYNSLKQKYHFYNRVYSKAALTGKGKLKISSLPAKDRTLLSKAYKSPASTGDINKVIRSAKGLSRQELSLLSNTTHMRTVEKILREYELSSFKKSTLKPLKVLCEGILGSLG
jgi:hypothetical protein